jgi:hypothetical protein
MIDTADDESDVIDAEITIPSPHRRHRIQRIYPPKV